MAADVIQIDPHDPNGEYMRVVDAVGGTVIRLGGEHSGADLNVFWPGLGEK